MCMCVLQRKTNNWLPKLIMRGEKYFSEKKTGKALVELVACYGCKVWLLKREERRKLLGLEMGYLRRSARVSRLQKIPITTFGRKR